MLQIQRREINQFAAGQHTAAEGRLVSSLKTRPHLFFLDDLNCANTDSVTGAQPPLELFRQVLSQGANFTVVIQKTICDPHLPRAHFLQFIKE